MIEFRILGALEVCLDGSVVHIGGARQRALLAALLVRAGEPVSADSLVQALWGEEASPAAVKALYVRASRLRRALGSAAGRLQTVGGGYRLVVSSDELDASRFVCGYERGRALASAGRAAAAADAFREALDIWRGPALADLRYERFAQGEIQRLEELRVLALEERTEAELALGRHARLVGELEALVREHPLRERLRAQLMLALYRSGRHADALAAFRDARSVLDSELGLEPGPELRRLEQAVLTHDPALAPGGGRAFEQAIPPAPPTPTFGREQELRNILIALERREARFLTLIGAGGVGKTRLAIEAARAAGGCFVSLASTADPDRVPAAICDALAVTRIPGEPAADALHRALARESMLLVLDNLEHLLPAAPLFGALLDRAPGLTILGTSRQRVRIKAERVFPVAPLPVVSDPSKSPAVALFGDRARAHDPAFTVTEDNMPAIVEVCERLGGLPLAIELAAGRLSVLEPAALATRLGNALEVLDHGPQDAPVRQQTLRATLDWSFDLLDGEERDAFTALGAFAGGSELEAAESVTGSALPVLEGLVAKSLLSARAGRLLMLEPVRQYAAMRLAGRGDADVVRGRHAAHFAALAATTEHELWARGHASPELTRMHREHDNLHAAVTWCLESGALRDALTLVGGLASYGWLAHADIEVRQWCDRALTAAGDDAPAPLRARALLASAHNRSDPAERIDRGTPALALFQTIDDDFGIARSLLLLSNAHNNNGAYARGRRLAEQALEHARRLDDDVMIGAALAEISHAIPRIEEALPFAREAATILRAAQAPQRMAALLSSLGMSALGEHAYEHAERLEREALEAALALNDAYTLALVYGNIGLAALLAGNATSAHKAFRDELITAQAHGLLTFYFEGLLGLAAVAAGRGADHRAAALEAAAWQHNDRPIYASEQPVYDQLQRRFIAPARRRLGQKAWQSASGAGREMTADAAIALALEEPSPRPVPKTPSAV